MATLTVQEIKQTVPFEADAPYGGQYILDSMSFLLTGGELMPPWWSFQRDIELRRFFKRSDHLSSAVFNITAKMMAIPWKILPRDTSIQSHIKQAAEYEYNLRYNSEFLGGFNAAYQRYLEDLMTQDNGGFMLVMGDGTISEPLRNRPVGVMHLDSKRCVRTGSVEFPVMYYHDDGKAYKIHTARLIASAQMSSPDREMYGVGFCAVSRAINVAQNLMDIARYEQEKLGSRPPRILLVGQGVSAAQIYAAFQEAELNADNQLLEHYAKIIAIGSANNVDIDVLIKDLASVPDGFDKEKSTTLAMFAIALAFGVDARELWPNSASGATKADALVQHLKAQGKGTGLIIAETQRGIESRFLPDHLEMRFDYIDDEQDKVRAEIRKTRSEQRKADLDSGVLNIRVIRQQMLEDYEITQTQFEELELADGRLEDGSDVLLLFSSNDKIIQALLDIGMTATEAINSGGEDVLALIEERLETAQKVAYNSTQETAKKRARQAIAALNALMRKIKEKAMQEQMELQTDVSASDNSDDMDMDMGERQGEEAERPPAREKPEQLPQ